MGCPSITVRSEILRSLPNMTRVLRTDVISQLPPPAAFNHIILPLLSLLRSGYVILVSILQCLFSRDAFLLHTLIPRLSIFLLQFPAYFKWGIQCHAHFCLILGQISFEQIIDFMRSLHKVQEKDTYTEWTVSSFVCPHISPSNLLHESQLSGDLHWQTLSEFNTGSYRTNITPNLY